MVLAYISETEGVKMTRLVRLWTTFLVLAVPWLFAQPPALITIDVENIVEYEADVPEVAKLATTATRTTGAASSNFYPVLWVADVIAINGTPAKGTWTVRGHQLFRGPIQTPGRAIADSSGAYFFDWIFDLLQADGTPIGSLMAVGTGGAPKPPGAPSLILQANMAVTGGTGAFLGIRGQAGQGGNTVPLRTASMSEDPAFRRSLGGGSRRYVFQLIPMTRPDVVVTREGLAIVHASNFSLVSPSNPAHPGEFLAVFASGLGPTRPGVDPGQPFPATPPQLVNSPVEVSVGGKPAEVLYAGGYPGAVDIYQVNFRVPDNSGSGATTLRLTSAFISGSDVTFPIQ
jgi:uncharacterized protein (TIGR03437 family)